MCRRALIGLEPTPEAAGAARRFVAQRLRTWQADAVAEGTTLAVSELVTNAVLHARTPIEVGLCLTGGSLEVSVRDHDPRPPVMRPVRPNLLADLDALTRSPDDHDTDERHHSLQAGRSGSIAAGRGLLIVDALADEWGVSERVDGKQVWLTLPVRWPYEQLCTCARAPSVSASGRPCWHIAGRWDAPD